MSASGLVSEWRFLSSKSRAVRAPVVARFRSTNGVRQRPSGEQGAIHDSLGDTVSWPSSLIRSAADQQDER